MPNKFQIPIPNQIGSNQSVQFLDNNIDSLDQYNYYIRVKSFDKLYVYVSSPDTLRGHQDIHGVFIGSWRERIDIVEILDALITRTTNTDVIKYLYKQVTVIPSPISVTYKPYNPSRTVQELQDYIAEEISRHIQKEIDDKMVRNIISS